MELILILFDNSPFAVVLVVACEAGTRMIQ